MTLSDDAVEEHASTIYDAFTQKHRIDPLTEETELPVPDAYAIQERVIADLLGDDGDILGYKLGLVSEAKQEQLGIDEPIFCAVPADFQIDGTIPASELMAPRVEAEIGLILAEDLEPPVSPADVLSKTSHVVPVIEVLESRFKAWQIPTAQDVIADITSGCKLIVGECVRAPTDVDIAMEGVTVSLNGELVETGLGADIMGHPARGVSWLADRLQDREETMQAGDLILTGGITAAVDIEPEDLVTIQFGSLGTVELLAE